MVSKLRALTLFLRFLFLCINAALSPILSNPALLDKKRCQIVCFEAEENHLHNFPSQCQSMEEVCYGACPDPALGNHSELFLF